MDNNQQMERKRDAWQEANAGWRLYGQTSVKLQPELKLFLEGEVDFHIRKNFSFPNSPRQEE